MRHDLEDTLNNLDPLTGTPNRIAMLTRLREQHQLVKRGAHSCAVALLDLDHFKSVNDAIERADKALSAAKAAGCNRTIVWEEAERSEVRALAASPAHASQ